MDLVKLSKVYLYVGTQEMKFDIIKHRSSATQSNGKLILLITTIACITWLFVMFPQDPFYSALPPKRCLWGLPKATYVNTNKIDNHFFNSCFFSPCSHSATFNVKSQIFFFFKIYSVFYSISLLLSLRTWTKFAGQKKHLAGSTPLSV